MVEMVVQKQDCTVWLRMVAVVVVMSLAFDLLAMMPRSVVQGVWVDAKFKRLAAHESEVRGAPVPPCTPLVRP